MQGANAQNPILDNCTPNLKQKILDAYAEAIDMARNANTIQSDFQEDNMNPVLMEVVFDTFQTYFTSETPEPGVLSAGMLPNGPSIGEDLKSKW